LFLVLIGKFDPKSNFSLEWPELGLKEPNSVKTGRKMWFSKADNSIT